MSNISGASSSGSGTLGNAPPVSFPGVSSGIDYNAIIQKYTAGTLLQERPTRAQITSLNAQNAAILKISSLIGSVQDALTALSDPTIMQAFSATPGNTASGTAAATTERTTGGAPPIPGTYVINAQTAATATTITNNPLANGSIDANVPLAEAGTAVSATNGGVSSGILTVNGVSINYDVTTQSLTTIVSQIDGTLSATTGGSAVLNADGTVTLTGVQTLGSGADRGNLLHVLKLDIAQIAAGTVTSATTIAGINEAATLNQSGNAGFATAVTSGTFTINGVAFTVDAAKQNLADLISSINASSAGVTASYNTETSSLVITNKTPGPQSVLLGANGDTSNFLSASGLTTGTTHAGTQATLTYTDVQGPHTAYSSTNTFRNVVPGIDLIVGASSPSSLPAGSTFYSVTVAPDPTKAEAAITTFITAYNAVIATLNNDTVAPTVTAGRNAATNTATSTQTRAGGVLYGNFQVSSLRDRLVQLVSGFIPTGSPSYNSLASVGIRLDTSSQTVGASKQSDTNDATDSTSSDGTVTVNTTSGQLAALDTAKFEAAYAANTAAVTSLFTLIPSFSNTGASSAIRTAAPGSPAGFAYQLGEVLANTNGITTFLAGTVINPRSLASVLLTTATDTNDRQIASLWQRIDLINREATNQADSLRAQFSASESQIARLQALQTQIASIGR
jgi:flagellar hook-associated protein 2